MKSKSIRTLQILTSAGAGLYLLGIVVAIVFGDFSFISQDDYLTTILLLVFIAGFAFSWRRIEIAAIIFMIWNVVVWIWDLYLYREADYSMTSAMASYFMVIGAFFLLEHYKTNKANVPSEMNQWSYILRVLLINYLILYSIVVLSELLAGEPVNFISFPYIIYPILLLIFLAGSVVSWFYELVAGYIFLFWSALLIFGTFAYSEFGSLGPWILFGLPVMLQGIFYVRNHYKYKTKQKAVDAN